MVSSRRLWVEEVSLLFFAWHLCYHAAQISEGSMYMSWKRMFERSRALVASERSIVLSMIYTFNQRRSSKRSKQKKRIMTV
jgi:hypothetical protein